MTNVSQLASHIRPLLRAQVVLALLAAAFVAVPPAASAGTSPAANAATPGVVAVVRDADGSLSVESVVVAASRRNDSGAVADTVRALRRRPDVVAADVDVTTNLLGTTTVLGGDPYRSDQWALTTLEAETAWRDSTGHGVTVAVLDTGVQASHPDLRGTVLPGKDFTGGGGDGRTDVKGHGTHVAGIVAAARGNGVGTVGLAYHAAILPVQVLGDDGGGLLSWAAKGIIWATDAGADVINMSFGASSGNSVLDTAVAYAKSRGVVLVAASGNEGASRAYWPAAHRDVIAVGATTSADAVATFSNHDAALDVVAPGARVVSTCVTSRWCLMTGTSMAAPHVAAAAAAIRAVRPDLQPAEVRTLLQRSAVDLRPSGHDAAAGHGRINVRRALHDALTASDPFADAAFGLDRVGASSDGRAVAVATSQEAFPTGAQMAVVARSDLFADSLTGAALAGDRGPVLFTPGGPDAPLGAETAQELGRVLRPGAPVYVLGGDHAVSRRAAADIAALGFDVRRIAGATRVETAASIADEVLRIASASGSGSVPRVLLARSDHWADAVTGSAYAAVSDTPILLTHPRRLEAPTRDWLARHEVAEVVLLGGDAAVSHTVAGHVDAVAGTVRRAAGADRAETAAVVARDLWRRRSGAADDRFIVVEGYSTGSWAPAVAAAVLSAKVGAPQLLVAAEDVPARTAAYLTSLDYAGDRPAAATAVGGQIRPRVGYELIPLIGRS